MPDWTGAKCLDEDPETFFGPHVCNNECDGERGCHIAKSETGRFMRIQRAKQLCGACPRREACLEYALSTKQPFGVWGGTTERDRRILLKERNNGG